MTKEQQRQFQTDLIVRLNNIERRLDMLQKAQEQVIAALGRIKLPDIWDRYPKTPAVPWPQQPPWQTPWPWRYPYPGTWV